MKTESILWSPESLHPGENKYLQAVKEVRHSIEGIYNEYLEFEKAEIIE
jgi:glutamate dehydrogenase (NADP+)